MKSVESDDLESDQYYVLFFELFFEGVVTFYWFPC